MMENGLSLADVAAVSKDNDTWGGSGAWIWIILLFCLFGGNWNNDRNYATSADVQRANEAEITNSRFNTIAQNQAFNAYDNASLIAQNRYDNAQLINQNTMSMLTTGNNIINSQTCGFNTVNGNITGVGYEVQNVGCGINRNIDSVKFENAQNTCAITNAIHHEGELTRAMMQENVVQSLRDRLEEKDRLYQAANFQLSQFSQTQNILDSLGRWVSNPPTPQVYYGYGMSTTGTYAG